MAELPSGTVTFLLTDIEDLHGRFCCLTVLGQAATFRGEWHAAFTILSDALLAAQAFRDPWDVAHGLLSLAVLASERDQAARAARLFSAPATLVERIGSDTFAAYKQMCELGVARVRSHLGDEAFAAAWDMGASMTEAQWSTYALDAESA